MKLLDHILIGLGKLTVALLPVILLLAMGMAFYGVTLRGIAGKPDIAAVKDNLDQATQPFELSPERGRYAIIVSLAEDGTFSLRPDLGMMVYPDVGYYNGKFYSYFAPGISVFALPFYQLGLLYNLPQVAAYASVAVTAILNLVLLYVICRWVFRLPLWASLAAPIIFGFGTTSWSYAITLYQHQMTTFLILSSFMAVWKITQGTRWNPILASWVWFAFGFAVFIDYPNVLLMAPVMLYFAWSLFERVNIVGKKLTVTIRPSLLLTSVVLITWIFVHGYYNQVNFGSWKRVSGSLVGYKSILEKDLQNQENPEAVIEGEKGEKNPVKFFSEEKTPFGFYTLLYSEDRGLLLYAPILAVGILGLFWAARQKNAAMSALIGSVGVNVFLYSSWGDPWGGWAYGPRYLIPSMAYLSVFAMLWLVHGKWRPFFRIISWPLFGFSSAVALLGALTTNSVPPKVEADYLKTGYNFFRNLDFYLDGRSGSFALREYLWPYVTLGQLFGYIWLFLLVIMFVLLIVMPLFRRRNGH